MKINLLNSNIEVDIYFQYNIPAGITKAYIFDTVNNIEYEGMALCGNDDQFNKKIGRKIALARLFEEFPVAWPQELRKDIWETLKDRGMKLT
jgi:hypothetical protein